MTFGEIVGIVASVIAIFAFITGITSLAQLRSWLARRSTLRVDVPSQARPGDAWSAVFLPVHYWIGIIAFAITAAGVAWLIVEGEPHSALSPVHAATLIGFECFGLTYACTVAVLGRRHILDQETFRLAIVFPIAGAVLGLAIGITEAGDLPILLSTIAFLGFGGCVSAIGALAGEIIAAAFFWLDMREERSRLERYSRRF